MTARRAAILADRTSGAGEIRVIFPGPDIPALCTGNRYAIGWWTVSGITDVRIDLYYQGSLEKTLVARTPNDGSGSGCAR